MSANKTDERKTEKVDLGNKQDPDMKMESQATAEKAEEDVCSSCGERRKYRSEKEQRDLINRLSRIEGQIRGLKRMLEENAYCPDVLRQSSAAASALNSFNKVLLANHIRTCVAEDIRNGQDDTIDELVDTIYKLMK